MEEILNRHPYNLDEEQKTWVNETLNSLTLDEKIGQLFLMVSGMDPNQKVEDEIKQFNPGGFMYRPGNQEEIYASHKMIQELSKVPAFLAANTEAGGNGIVNDNGTFVGSNMQVGATNDPEYGYKQGVVAGKELIGVGGNLSFAPVVDINFEWRSPIANLRAYSDNTDKVLAFGVANVKGTQEQGAAVSVKHFPGDGVDTRDQHVATTMNHLSLEEWDKTYGKVYNACFEAGALTTMVGHFFVPNIMEDLGAEDDKWVPTSYNKTVLNKLLRERLGFNGLVLTDATQMAGMVSVTPREKLVPLSIANGADVFLFTKNMEEDINFMKKGYEEGVLTEERLNEAVLRILATKAKLNLHKGELFTEEKLAQVGTEENKQVALEVADKSITLIRNEQNMFPITNMKRIKLLPFFRKDMFGNKDEKTLNYLVEKFNSEGIEVDVFDYEEKPFMGIVDAAVSLKETKEKYDAVFYVSCIQPSSNTSNLLVEWNAAVGMDAPNLVTDIPTAWISLGSPYHLNDAPTVRNFINAYSKTPTNIDSLFEKMMGRSEFKGVSPVNHEVGYPKYHKALDIKYDY